MQARQLRPVAEAQAILRAQDDLVADLEVLGQDVEDARRHTGFDVQQRDGAAPELAQASVDALEQIVGLVFFDFQVRVTNDAKQIRALDLRSREELLDVRANDVLDEDVRRRASGTDRRWQRDEPRKHVRHLHPGELGPPAVADHDREVLAQIRNERKGMARIERERREHRADLAREVAAQVLAHRRRPRVLVEKRNLIRLEQLAKLDPRRGLIAQHLARARAHRLELLLGVVSIRSDVLDFLAQLLQRRRHADHEELVEVRAGDRQELHALEQRMGRVARLREHTFVELEPAQLAVDVERWILEVCRIGALRRCLRCWGGPGLPLRTALCRRTRLCHCRFSRGVHG